MQSIQSIKSGLIFDDDTEIFYYKGGHCTCCIQKTFNLNLIYVDWFVHIKNEKPCWSTIALYLCDTCSYFCPHTTHGHLEHDALEKIIFNIKKAKYEYIKSKL